MSLDTNANAISAALCCNWKKAISENKSLLKKNSQDLEALNRLAYAYCQTGDLQDAKKIYQKVLKIDPYNLIAQKNLKKINKASCAKHFQQAQIISPSLFLEEPGKTKTIYLFNLAPANTLSTLTLGQPVDLVLKKHSIEVRAKKNTYLGVIPDDVSFRLIKFIKGGNKYEAFIKSIGQNKLSIFVKEVSKAAKFRNQPTFLPKNTYGTSCFSSSF